MDIKFKINDYVELMFSESEEKVCECCESITTYHPPKRKTIGRVKEISIRQDGTYYGVDQLRTGSANTTYIFKEEDLNELKDTKND